MKLEELNPVLTWKEEPFPPKSNTDGQMPNQFGSKQGLSENKILFSTTSEDSWDA